MKTLLALLLSCLTVSATAPLPPGYVALLASPKAATVQQNARMVKAAPAIVVPPTQHVLLFSWSNPNLGPLANCVSVVSFATNIGQPYPWPVIASMPCATTNTFAATNPVAPAFWHVYNLNTNTGLTSK
jgi:hypothetical protein